MRVDSPIDPPAESEMVPENPKSLSYMRVDPSSEIRNGSGGIRNPCPTCGLTLPAKSEMLVKESEPSSYMRVDPSSKSRNDSGGIRNPCATFGSTLPAKSEMLFEESDVLVLHAGWPFQRNPKCFSRGPTTWSYMQIDPASKIKKRFRRNPTCGLTLPAKSEMLFEESDNRVLHAGGPFQTNPNCSGGVQNPAVAWIRRREPKKRLVQPWTETPQVFGKRLKEICKDINDNCDVEGLCRKFPKRIQDVAEKFGDPMNR